MYNYCFGRSVLVNWEKLNSILYSGVLKRISIRLSISYMFRHICSSSSLIWSLQFSQDIPHGLQVKVSGCAACPAGPGCTTSNGRTGLFAGTHFSRFGTSLLWARCKSLARNTDTPGTTNLHLAYGGNGWALLYIYECLFQTYINVV